MSKKSEMIRVTRVEKDFIHQLRGNEEVLRLAILNSIQDCIMKANTHKRAEQIEIFNHYEESAQKLSKLLASIQS